MPGRGLWGVGVAAAILFQPLFAQEPSEVARWIRRLSSEDLRVREEETRKLILSGERILPAVQRLLADCQDPEVKERLRFVQAEIQARQRQSRVGPALAKDALLARLLSSESARDVLAGLIRLTGKTPVRRGAFFEVEHVGEGEEGLGAAEWVGLLREILERSRHEGRSDPESWAQIQMLALHVAVRQRLTPLVPAIADLTAATDPGVRETAAAAAGEIGAGAGAAERAILLDRLAPLLKDSEESVRYAALGALSELSEKKIDPWAGSLLADPSARVRRRAIEAVVRWNAREESIRVAALLRDASAQVRRAALRALIDLNAGDRLPEILGCASDPDEYVRLEVLEAMAAFDAREARKELADFLADPCTMVRLRALELVETFQASDLAPQVTRLLDRTEIDSVRLRALRLLPKLSARDSVPAIVRILEERNPEMCVSALQALAVLAGRDQAARVAALLDREEPRVRVLAARLLLEWNCRDLVPRIAALLTCADREVKVSVAAALSVAGEGDPRTVAVLAEVAGGEGSRQEARALFALNGVFAPRSMEALRKAKPARATYSNVSLSQATAIVAREAGLRVEGRNCEDARMDFHFERGSGADMLQELAEAFSATGAFLLDDATGTIHVVSPAECLAHWRRRLAFRK